MLITRTDELSVNNIHADDGIDSDHSTVICNISTPKPPTMKKTITFRKWKDININDLCNDLKNSKMNDLKTTDVNEAVSSFNSELEDLVNQKAPLQSKVVTIKQNCPWYTNEIRTAKRRRRKLERQWRRSRLEAHKELLKTQRNEVKALTDAAKTQYYTGEVNKATNQKELFKTTNKLLYKQKCSTLPTHTSKQDLAEKFATFFSDKIVKIRSNLGEVNLDAALEYDTPFDGDSKLCAIKPASEADILKLIKSSPNKSCALDPLPTWLLKDCEESLLPVITRILNRSLCNGQMPLDLKTALLSPLIKKALLEANILKNYRPVSNLAYLSKLIEKVVDDRFCSHLINHKLHEAMQSSYQKFHSTETALLRVHNDLLQAVDSHGAAVLVLLDLSAAFDTVDHTILLTRLEHTMGITGKALQWFESYLKERTQCVVIDGIRSDQKELKYGFPQGSVLGPKLFLAYTQPLGKIARAHGVSFHLYADDTQIYMSFKPHLQSSADDAIKKINECVEAIKKWMSTNFLKLNDDKTEVIIFSRKTTRTKPNTTPPAVRVGSSEIQPKMQVRNLGVIFDSGLAMDKHVNNVCRKATFEIRNISKIRKYLTDQAAVTLIHAYITSRLDYCNSLLYGIPNNLMKKLQRVQNMAARVVSRTRKYDHITPVLRKLHWLPVRQRITFKILMMTYKALNGQAPTYICDMLKQYHPSRPLRSQSHHRLVEPATNTKTYGDRAFSNAAPILWNRLPLQIKQAKTLENFKQKLKMYLFSEAFN